MKLIVSLLNDKEAKEEGLVTRGSAYKREDYDMVILLNLRSCQA